MRYEYIGPFVDSTIKVLDKTIQCDISKGNISLVDADKITGDIAVIIKVKDESEGSVILNMSDDTALKLCEVMTGEQGASYSFELDSICELANMITGNAISALNDMGYDFNVFPPLIIERKSISKKTDGLEIFQVPLFTEYGEVSVNVALRTN
jgi:chemotaxis protein CheX